ncbi:MAG: hypothetical protein ABSC77_07625 [Terracidiphilus sp.]
MKMFTALLMAVALVSPAFAETPTLQGTHPQPRLPVVAPAAKPILLNTGKPITQNDKQQLLKSVKSTGLKLPVGPKIQLPPASSAPAGPITLTPDMMYKNDVAFAAADHPAEVAPYDGLIIFGSNEGSMVFNISVAPNTVYTLAFKVTALAKSPQFTIVSYGQSPETFTVSPGDAEFAYAFTASNKGNLHINVSSSNATWMFKSCEIVITPLN